jgi:hypothetical protein
MIFNFLLTPEYSHAALREFKRIFKQPFFGMLYGNYKSKLDAKDFIHTYNMGQEL